MRVLHLKRRAATAVLAALTCLGVTAGLAWGYVASVDRLEGSSRYATAVNASKYAFPTGPVSLVVLTPGADGYAVDYPAALTAAGDDGPVLLVPNSGTLQAVVCAELTRLQPTRIAVVGASITQTIVDQAEVCAEKAAPAPSPTSSTSSSTTATATPTTSTATSSTTSSSPPPAPGEVRYQSFITGYDWYDNTPPGSAQIAFSKCDGSPTVHCVAAGTGTYADPITLAVGHVISGGVSTPDFPAGTRFYVPNLRRYFMVEDVCGDGSTPQNGPCHTGYPAGAENWLDVWVDGRNMSETASENCMNAITKTVLTIRNPASNYAVVTGPIAGTSCTQQYGNTVVTS